ncbi:hypothetical protein LOK49_LG11G01933 [Camellia lanceoleosa]|uniref:Uncharacterized protein n=1 Tax=Camellia lanceoleosa TaxID=1840588 RepID=A0ACC0FWB3_9ERIC|nr:hypothetical protein LOK49_LG11G01933 [Camellia lanceoleosa]
MKAQIYVKLAKRNEKLKAFGRRKRRTSERVWSNRRKDWRSKRRRSSDGRVEDTDRARRYMDDLFLPFLQVGGANGPIFEDGPNFDTAFKLFHGKDGVVPLSERPFFHDKSLETKPAPQFNPLAAKAASISLSGFGSGGPFGFDFFSKNWNNQKKKSESSKKRKQSSQGGDSSKHEALGNEWLETGNCPIAKSFRAVSHVLPLVATALQPPPGMKIKCPPAVVAARAALARTALVKSLRPQPLPAKILVIGVLGMAANIPLGIWREHTQKFSLSWFTAVHACASS